MWFSSLLLALAPASGMASHATKPRCLSLWKHQPFQLCYPLLSSFAACWGRTASELHREPKMTKRHWNLLPRVCSEPSRLFFPQHKISDVPCSCAWYPRSHIWKTSSRWANCRRWDGDWETKTRKWILYLMGERHSPQGHLLKLLAMLGAVAP